MKKALILTAFSLLALGHAQIHTFGIERFEDEFTGEVECKQIVFDGTDGAGVNGVTLKQTPNGLRFDVSRSELPAYDVVHGHTAEANDTLYLRFPSVDLVKQFPIVFAKVTENAELRPNGYTSYVSSAIDPTTFHRLSQAAEDVRFRIESNGSQFDGTIPLRILEPLHGLAEACQIEEVG